MDDLEAEELRREVIAMRWYQKKLASHPNCRDPDHPGCEKCMEPAGDDDYQSQTYGGK